MDDTDQPGWTRDRIAVTERTIVVPGSVPESGPCTIDGDRRGEDESGAGECRRPERCALRFLPETFPGRIDERRVSVPGDPLQFFPGGCGEDELRPEPREGASEGQHVHLGRGRMESSDDGGRRTCSAQGADPIQQWLRVPQERLRFLFASARSGLAAIGLAPLRP